MNEQDFTVQRLLAEMQRLSETLVEMRVLLKHIDDKAEANATRLATIEEKTTQTRIAIGKLEVKNGLIATAMGAGAGVLGAIAKTKIGQ